MAESELETDGNLARVLDLGRGKRAERTSEAVHRAIDQCLLNMVFQPIVDLKEGRIFAYEALCRSRMPEFDSPPALIEAAIGVGRIGELGRLQRGLASRHCPDWPIFFNISPNEFDDGWLVRPDDAIFKHPKPVYIEITESVPLVFFEQCQSVLAELRRKGALLAIDDLGAGYSNLKYIADLAPDIVKLDRELVAGCTMEGPQYNLLRSIAKLCREVNAKVVAEGMETAEELEAVSSAGIEYGQGFFLGRPQISPSEITSPASELIASDGFKIRRASRVADGCEATSEETERRLGELEDLRSVLERSVRKARGEVVRLRKALDDAEGENERASTRMIEVEGTLAESEASRRKLASLFQAATLQAEPVPPPVEGATPERSPRLRRVAGLGLIWAAGLLAGLALYRYVPRVEEPRPMEEAIVSAVSAAPSRAARAASSTSVAVEAGEPEGPSEESIGAGADAVRAEIRAVIFSWADAWSAQDLDAYSTLYARGFVGEDGKNGGEWHLERRSRLEEPVFISVRVDDLEVQIESYSYASATFLQTYSSDSFTDRVRKEVALIREDGAWRISSETALD